MGRGEDRTSAQTRIEKERTYRFTNWFVGRIVPCLQVGMVQRLLTADPLRRVKAQHLRQEVDSKRVSIGVQGCKGYSGFDGQRPNVVLCLGQGLRVSLHASFRCNWTDSG